MFCILPPGVTENDPINCLSALLAAVGHKLLQLHSYKMELHKIFGAFPTLMKCKGEVSVTKSHYLTCQALGFKLFSII